MTTSKRRCFYIPAGDPDAYHEGRGYIPALVVEDEPGYRLFSGNGDGAVPWYWGRTLGEAQAVADKANADDFGLTPEDVREIVFSSMLASMGVDG